MIKKCIGCGSILQTEDMTKEGYIDKENYEKYNLCRRCFRLKHYGEFVSNTKNNDDFINILKSVSKTKSLVLYVVDLFTLNNNLDNINKYLNNNVILVITKRDIIPKSVKNDKLLEFIKNINTKNNIVDYCIVSSKNNDGFDDLYNKINKYKIDKNVYLVGNTNAGKSTLLNKLIKNYSSKDIEITTSILPSTTLNQIIVPLNDNLTLIDTPGIIDDENIINIVDYKLLKRIIPKVEIKPKTYQLKIKKSIEVENIIRVDYISGNIKSFTTYLSNDLRVMQINIDTHKDIFSNHEKYTFEINDREDIVVNGLGYIKIVGNGIIDIFAPKGVNVIKRKSMI